MSRRDSLPKIRVQWSINLFIACVMLSSGGIIVNRKYAEACFSVYKTSVDTRVLCGAMALRAGHNSCSSAHSKYPEKNLE